MPDKCRVSSNSLFINRALKGQELRLGVVRRSVPCSNILYYMTIKVGLDNLKSCLAAVQIGVATKVDLDNLKSCLAAVQIGVATPFRMGTI